jgi:aromatic-L-amino-acid/L-tryptophan decarboxylase
MTELEMVMTDWVAKAVGLPTCFLNSDPGPGAGVIQNTASDSTLIALLSARARVVARLSSKAEMGKNSDGEIITFENHDPKYFSNLVAYCSDQVSLG